MRPVYRSTNALFVGHIGNVLEQHGIPCLLRNAFLIGGTGELPPHECLPEVWVVDDSDYQRALEVIESVLEAPPAQPWVCPRCREEVEGQFGACWACGEPAPWREE